MNGNAIMAMMLGFALVISGCSGDAGGSGETINGVPESELGVDWNDLGFEELMRMRDKYLSTQQEANFSVDWIRNSIDSFPEVPLVKFTDPIEHTEMMVSCLTDRGYEVRPNSSGYVYIDLKGKNGVQQVVDDYICDAQYTVDPRTRTDMFPRVRAEQLYTYWVNDFKVCSASLGYSVGEFPSLETWLDDYYGNNGRWNAPSEIRKQIRSQDEQEELDSKCPEFPEDFWPVIPSV